jgi:hypothetical protein
MTLGEVFAQAARRDTSHDGPGLPLKDGPLRYTEIHKEGRFETRLSSSVDPDAFVECSIPDDGLEATKNYCRVQFLSMTFKAAIAGMKRRKQGRGPAEAAAPWIAKLFEYCQAKGISPIALMAFHKKWESSHKAPTKDE